MTQPSQNVARPIAVVALLGLTIIFLTLIPASLRAAPYVGVSKLVLACLAAAAAWVLFRRDDNTAWAITFGVGTVTVLCGLVSRTLGLPLVSNYMGMWGEPGYLGYLLCGAVLAALATWVMLGRYGVTRLAAAIACYMITSTHLGLLPEGLHAGAVVGTSQICLMILGLIGGPVILADRSARAWGLMLATGTFNTATAGYLVTGDVPSSISPWWTVAILANVLSGVVLAVLAVRVFLLRWERNHPKPDPLAPQEDHLSPAKQVVPADAVKAAEPKEPVGPERVRA